MRTPKPPRVDAMGTMDILAVLGDDDHTPPPPADEEEGA